MSLTGAPSAGSTAAVLATSPELKALQKRALVEDNVIDWLATQKIYTPANLAVLASEEKFVYTNIIDPALAAQVEFKLLGDKGNLIMLWRLCRESIDAPSASGGITNRVDEDKLPTDI